MKFKISKKFQKIQNSKNKKFKISCLNNFGYKLKILATGISAFKNNKNSALSLEIYIWVPSTLSIFLIYYEEKKHVVNSESQNSSLICFACSSRVGVYSEASYWMSPHNRLIQMKNQTKMHIKWNLIMGIKWSHPR